MPYPRKRSLIRFGRARSACLKPLLRGINNHAAGSLKVLSAK